MHDCTISMSAAKQGVRGAPASAPQSGQVTTVEVRAQRTQEDLGGKIEQQATLGTCVP